MNSMLSPASRPNCAPAVPCGAPARGGQAIAGPGLLTFRQKLNDRSCHELFRSEP